LVLELLEDDRRPLTALTADLALWGEILPVFADLLMVLLGTSVTPYTHLAAPGSAGTNAGDPLRTGVLQRDQLLLRLRQPLVGQALHVLWVNQPPERSPDGIQFSPACQAGHPLTRRAENITGLGRRQPLLDLSDAPRSLRHAFASFPRLGMDIITIYLNK
jgi:hypothetical protein